MNSEHISFTYCCRKNETCDWAGRFPSFTLCLLHTYCWSRSISSTRPTKGCDLALDPGRSQGDRNIYCQHDTILTASPTQFQEREGSLHSHIPTTLMHKAKSSDESKSLHIIIYTHSIPRCATCIFDRTYSRKSNLQNITCEQARRGHSGQFNLRWHGVD